MVSRHFLPLNSLIFRTRANLQAEPIEEPYHDEPDNDMTALPQLAHKSTSDLNLAGSVDNENDNAAGKPTIKKKFWVRMVHTPLTVLKLDISFPKKLLKRNHKTSDDEKKEKPRPEISMPFNFEHLGTGGDLALRPSEIKRGSVFMKEPKRAPLVDNGWGPSISHPHIGGAHFDTDGTAFELEDNESDWEDCEPTRVFTRGG